MRIFICCLLLVFCAFNTTATEFDFCWEYGPLAQIQSFEVSDCPNGEDTCILKRGTIANISIVFVSPTTAKTVKAELHGVLNGLPLPLFNQKTDVCKYGGLSCPLEFDKSYTYSHDLDIKTFYPSISLKLRYELIGDRKILLCVEIPCKIE